MGAVDEKSSKERQVPSSRDILNQISPF